MSNYILYINIIIALSAILWSKFFKLAFYHHNVGEWTEKGTLQFSLVILGWWTWTCWFWTSASLLRGILQVPS